MEVMETTIAVAVAIDMAAVAIVREANIKLTLELLSPFLLLQPVKNHKSVSDVVDGFVI